MKKNCIYKKLKSEKGLVSLIVIYSVLFFSIVLLGIYARVTMNEKKQVNYTAEIKTKYEKNLDRLDEVYDITK